MTPASSTTASASVRPGSRSSTRRRWLWPAWPRWSRSEAPARRTVRRRTLGGRRGDRGRDRRRAGRCHSRRRAPVRRRCRPEVALALGYDTDEALGAAVGRLKRLARRAGRPQSPAGRPRPGRDTELAVDRADLGADRVARDEQPFADLADREMRLQVGQQPSSAGVSGELPPATRVSALVDESLAELRDLVDAARRVRAGGCRMSSISWSRWRAVAWSPIAPVHLGELQAGAHGQGRQARTCSDGRARIARVSWRSASSGRPGARPAGPRRRTRARSSRSRACGARRSRRAPSASGSAASSHRPGPSPARRARPRVDERVGVAERRPPARSLREQVAAPVGVAGEQVRFAAHARAPCRATGSTAAPASTAKSASASICSGPPGHMNARTSPARTRTTPSRPTGTRSNEAARGSPPSVGPRRSGRSAPRSSAASTASGGYASIAGSPSAASQRCTVDIWPAW